MTTRKISDEQALVRIAEAVEPWEGEWSDMSGIIERVSDIVEATGRTILDSATASIGEWPDGEILNEFIEDGET